MTPTRRFGCIDEGARALRKPSLYFRIFHLEPAYPPLNIVAYTLSKAVLLNPSDVQLQYGSCSRLFSLKMKLWKTRHQDWQKRYMHLTPSLQNPCFWKCLTSVVQPAMPGWAGPLGLSKLPCGPTRARDDRVMDISMVRPVPESANIDVSLYTGRTSCATGRGCGIVNPE
jgi:hypothetical protein